MALMCIHGGAECTGCMMCREYDDKPAVLYANKYRTCHVPVKEDDPEEMEDRKWD